MTTTARAARADRRRDGVAFRLGDDAARGETLDRLGVAHEVRVVSAHRTPDLLFDYAAQAAQSRGLQRDHRRRRRRGASAGHARRQDAAAGARRAGPVARRSAAWIRCCRSCRCRRACRWRRSRSARPARSMPPCSPRRCWRCTTPAVARAPGRLPAEQTQAGARTPGSAPRVNACTAYGRHPRRRPARAHARARGRAAGRALPRASTAPPMPAPDRSRRCVHGRLARLRARWQDFAAPRRRGDLRFRERAGRDGAMAGRAHTRVPESARAGGRAGSTRRENAVPRTRPGHAGVRDRRQPRRSGAALARRSARRPS